MDKDKMVLSPFQVKAIIAFHAGMNVLITAPTGCGKTLPAEKAIEHFTSIGKRVIYTSPIKALSNQKYHDFSKKYGGDAVGLLTGDNKHNPTASILVMTTEILQNKLLNPTSTSSLLVDFELTSVGCVVFDEVHYINDPERGTVWEQCIMLLPKDVLLVMLSATIGHPERFAKWVETVRGREVVICSTSERIVPLVFSEFFTATQKQLERVKLKKDDKTKLHIEARLLNQFRPMHHPTTGKLDLVSVQEVDTHIGLVKRCQGDATMSRKYVLNQLCKALKEKDMFPALCFVFSRKQIEEMSREVTEALFDEGERDYEVEPICRQMLVAKLRNWKEYVMMPEYHFYLDLFRKGVAIHHAGMLPIFREMVEILYEQKYIKLLLATETFAIGLNMPTKTVCFTSLSKHDGHKHRELHPHEFTQMAGRAGRRGIDPLGHVVLVPNLFAHRIDPTHYVHLFKADPEPIESKFRVSYDLALQNDCDLPTVVRTIEQSMLYGQTHPSMLADLAQRLETLEANLRVMEPFVTQEVRDVCDHYLLLNEKSQYTKKKGDRGLFQQQLERIETEHPRVRNEVVLVRQYDVTRDEAVKLRARTTELTHLAETQAQAVLALLEQHGFHVEPRRSIAKATHEVHPLAFTDTLLRANYFHGVDAPDLFAVLSCFLQFTHHDDVTKTLTPPWHQDLLAYAQERLYVYGAYEAAHQLEKPSTAPYELQYDLMEPVRTWMTKCDDEASCLVFLDELKKEKNVFTGEFIKCCLKLTNVARELETVDDPELTQTLRAGTAMLTKFVCTNQSLYV